MKNSIWNTIVVLFLLSCTTKTEPHVASGEPEKNTSGVSLVVLGTIQDGGSPHIGCLRDCCKALFANPDPTRQVVSLGLIDADNKRKYLFEATPDIARQLKALKGFGANENEMPDGIFLTHAHIGHYAGLMYLGKEAGNATEVPVFTMPKMREFLKANGPWEQLVSAENIRLVSIENEQAVILSPNLKVVPLLVPHRDEYSETVGYIIHGPTKSALFIPDIDKWEKWDKEIIEEIKKVDYAFLDATFFSGKELDNRDMAQIPHPSIAESMAKFDKLSDAERKKVVFIHFNHTNPVIDPTSEEAKEVIGRGFRLAKFHEVFGL